MSYDGSNVDFGNPLYSEKLDTTPATTSYDASDKKYMPGVAEVSSQIPYFSGNDKQSLDA